MLITSITKINVVECRINYCWTKLCLFLVVRSKDHWRRSSCTRKFWRISVPAGKQCSRELDSLSCQLKCPFSPKFTVFAGKTYRRSGGESGYFLNFPRTLSRPKSRFKSNEDASWRNLLSARKRIKKSILCPHIWSPWRKFLKRNFRRIIYEVENQPLP